MQLCFVPEGAAATLVLVADELLLVNGGGHSFS